MSGLYDRVVRPEEKPKRAKHRVSGAITAAVFLFLIAMIVWVSWISGQGARFNRFVIGLSRATTYAYQNDGAVARYDGERIALSPDNMYHLYSYLGLTGAGTEKFFLPGEEAEISVDYGSGARLEFWAVPPKRGSRMDGLFVHFVYPEGGSYSYVSYQMTLDTVVVRYLMYGNESAGK